MRTRVVAAGGGDTGHFLVRRAVVDLLRGDLHVAEPLRPRPRKDLAGAGGHGGANGHTGTLQDHSSRPGTPLNGGLGKKHAVIQSGHLLPQGVVWPTYGHASKPREATPAGQLIFRGDLPPVPGARVRTHPAAPGGRGPAPPPARRARHAGRIPVTGASGRSPAGQSGLTAAPAVCHWRPGRHGTVRMRPSCTTDTTRSPFSVNTSPRASPRAPTATGESWAYSSHRSARNGRWNHIAWSRLAPLVWPSAQDRPCRSSTVSSSVMSEA